MTCKPTGLMLIQLLRFVRSHDMQDPHIEDDAVVFGVEVAMNGKVLPFWGWERVQTMIEARDALGY